MLKAWLYLAFGSANFKLGGTLLRGAAKSRQTEMSSKQAEKWMLAMRDQELQMNLPLAVIHRTFNMPISFGFLQCYMNATCKTLPLQLHWYNTAWLGRMEVWKVDGSAVKKEETRPHPLKLKGEMRETEKEREKEKPTSPLAQ